MAQSNRRCACTYPNYNPFTDRCIICGGYYSKNLITNKELPMTPNDKLPETPQEQINKQAEYYSGYNENEDHTPISKGKYYGYIAGAAAYAPWKVKHDELAIENENLRRWKMEAAELLTQIHSYAHKHLEIKLGASTVEFVISMAKERDALKDKHDALKTVLQEFVSNHEAGLLPNRFVYDKAIKILNDGL